MTHSGGAAAAREHQSEESDQRALEDRARDILGRDADGVHWPYGPNIYVQMRADLLDWTDQHNLKSGNTGCSSGLHWLERGRCAKRECYPDGKAMLHAHEWAGRLDPATLGTSVAVALLRQGARELINGIAH